MPQGSVLGISPFLQAKLRSTGKNIYFILSIYSTIALTKIYLKECLPCLRVAEIRDQQHRVFIYWRKYIKVSRQPYLGQHSYASSCYSNRFFVVKASMLTV